MKYNIKYIVEKDLGKVTAFCENWKGQVTEEISKRNLYSVVPFISPILSDKCDRLWAVTKVRGDDTFEEETGKRIARAKLLIKINHSINSIFDRANDNMYEQAIRLEELSSSYFIKEVKSRGHFYRVSDKFGGT